MNEFAEYRRKFYQLGNDVSEMQAAAIISSADRCCSLQTAREIGVDPEKGSGGKPQPVFGRICSPLTIGNSMSLQPPDTNGQKQWESVHQCPKCGHTLNLGEMDLRAISTGMIVCPRCEWSGPVRIEIVEPEDAD
jgi:predicted RNA-binding Zn-ribbon protein involved in translation (DUF1610 family)